MDLSSFFTEAYNAVKSCTAPNKIPPTIIHKKAGPLLKAECIRINTEKGGCLTGQAEVTTAGNLSAKFLIHAVPPRWLNGERGEYQLLCDTYSNALKKAEKIKASIEQEKLKLEERKLKAAKELQAMSDKAAMEREKLKARTAIKNRVVGERKSSKN